MRRELIKPLFASMAAAVWLAVPGAAFACSMAGEWVRPTNFELVQMADAIVVATAVREVRQSDESAVSFRVESTLKGVPPSTWVNSSARLGKTVPSDQTDLSGSHPEGHAGPCNRYTFRKGGRYLLFLAKTTHGTWEPAGSAFSRISEDYVAGSVWTRTVQRYVALQERLGPTEEIDALAAMLDSGKGPNGETLSRAEATDIADHLSSLSPWKPTAFLLDAWRRLERGEEPRFGTRSPAANRENNADAAALTSLLMGEPDPGPEDMAARKRAILVALVTGDHPEARPLFDGFLAAPVQNPEQIGLALRFLAKNGEYSRAFHWIETRLMDLLPSLPPPSAMRLIGDVAEAQSGDEASERQRWQGDPRARTVWPELALRLYWYQVDRFGADRAYRPGEAIAAIAIKDFRERPLVTRALAAGYKPEVADWAIAELRNETLRRSWEQRLAAANEAALPEEDDPARLPLQVLLGAWQSDNIPVLAQTYCQSASRRRLLIELLGTHGHSLYADLVARIAATPSLTAEERGLLQKAIGDMAARESRENRGLFTSYASLTTLLDRVKKAEKVAAKPITCG